MGAIASSASSPSRLFRGDTTDNGDVAQRWSVNDISIAINTSAGHAYNCVLTIDDGVVGLQMVEPQTDELVDSDDRGYSARRNTIIFT